MAEHNSKRGRCDHHGDGHGHGHGCHGHGHGCHGHAHAHGHGHDGHGHGHGQGHEHCKPKPSDSGGGTVPIDDSTPADGPFPEVIGLTPEEARAIVMQKKPDAVVDVVPGGETRPTLANIANTVRLWLDHAGKVQIVELPAVAAA